MTFDTIRTQVQKDYIDNLKQSSIRKISLTAGIISALIFSAYQMYKADFDVVYTLFVFIGTYISSQVIFETFPMKINKDLSTQVLDKMTVEYIESEIEDYKEYQKTLCNKISKNEERLVNVTKTLQEYQSLLKTKNPSDTKIFNLGDNFLHDSISGRTTGEEYAKTINLLTLLNNGHKVKIVIDDKLKSINDTFIKGMFNEVSKVFTADEIKQKVEIVGDKSYISLFEKNWIILQENSK